MNDGANEESPNADEVRLPEQRPRSDSRDADMLIPVGLIYFFITSPKFVIYGSEMSTSSSDRLV